MRRLASLVSCSVFVLVAGACNRDYAADCAPFEYDPVMRVCVCPEGTELVPEAGTCEAPDGGLPDGSTECVPTAETCNGRDDDCDGAIDGAAASASCGTRDHATGLACSAGACVVTTCADGFGDCDGSAENGCESPLDTLDHCGSCGNTCGWQCEASDCDDAIGIDGTGGTTCVVRTTGRVACFGSNSNGQLGTGDMGTGTDRSAFTDVLSPSGSGPLTNIVEISVGRFHTCARDADGAVWCWGRNTERQLGDGTTTDRALPVRARGVTGAVSIAAGERHTCAALSSGRVLCWGTNLSGNLGAGDTTERTSAVEVVGISSARRVASEGGATCAVLADDTVRCWGASAYGETGTGSGPSVPTPAAPVGLGQVADISLGGRFGCAIERDGDVLCWGSNLDTNWGELLRIDVFLTPQLVVPPVAAVRVFAGRWFVDGTGRVAEGDIIREGLTAVELADLRCARTPSGAVLCEERFGGPFLPMAPP